jgi:hypothetical protein
VSPAPRARLKLLFPALSRVEWLLWAALSLLFLAVRTTNLLAMPIFNDEVIYLLRADRFPANLNGTLGSGKLLHELAATAVYHLPGDDLLNLRLISVACGLLTLYGIAALGKALARPSAGLLAGLLLSLAPLIVLHDRLGITDAMLNACVPPILLASLAYVRQPAPTRRAAALIGGLVGLAALVKLTGIFLLAAPFVMLLFQAGPLGERLRRMAPLRTAVLVTLACIAVLAPFHYGGYELNKVEFRTLSERFGLLFSNLANGTGWLLTYLPGPLLLPLLALGLRGRAAGEARREALMLAGFGIALSAIFLIIGSQIFPRYMMQAWPPLLLACSIAIVELWQVPGHARLALRLLCGLSLAAALVWNLFFTQQLLFNPLHAPLVAADRSQYIESWTAGYNLPEMMDSIRAEAAAEGQITLVNHRRGRLIHMASNLYLNDDPRMTLREVDLTQPQAVTTIAELAATGPTYLLLDGEEYELLTIAERFPTATVTALYQHPVGGMRFYLLRVVSSVP